MPEKPEVITVAKCLEPKLVGRTIEQVQVYWDNIIASPSVEQFQKQLLHQKITSISTRGKWILVFLSKDLLLIHLRMEGKFFFRKEGTVRNKHEHVVFTLDNGIEWRFHDVRKFGKMWLLPKENAFLEKPLCDLGLEYDDVHLTGQYLYEKIHDRSLPIKTVLLDQSIIAGIGNIYDDEILFLSKIRPATKARRISKKQCESLVIHTKEILDRAVSLGGTTIRSFSSEEGVHGLFQNELCIHGQKICPLCHGPVKKIVVGGRGTYYCPVCQK